MRTHIRFCIKALVLCLLISCSFSANIKAAFPIKTTQSYTLDTAQANRDVVQHSLINTSPQQNISDEERRQKSRESGVYGILSLVFAICGWFPLAIIFGVIGVQPQRRNKEIATVGLVIGLAEFALFAFIILIALGVFPWI